MNMQTIDALAKHVTLTISTPRNTALKTTTWNAAPAGQWKLAKVTILFAVGHAALTGVRLRYNGAAILPWDQRSAFIVGDNERLEFPIDLYVQAPILVDTQNTDTGVHVHQLIGTFVPIDDSGNVPVYKPPTVLP